MQYVLSIVPYFPDGAFIDFILPPNIRLLDMFGLLNSAMISHHWDLVKRVASSFIRCLWRFIELEGLGSNMNKIPTYQVSAH